MQKQICLQDRNKTQLSKIIQFMSTAAIDNQNLILQTRKSRLKSLQLHNARNTQNVDRNNNKKVEAL